MMGELGNTAIVRFDLTTNQATTIANVNAKGDWPGTIIVDQAERFAYITYLGWSGISNITWGGAGRRVDIDPASPTYGQASTIMVDAGEVFPIALDPTGSRLIIGGGSAYVILEID
jgi:hypothetical protein